MENTVERNLGPREVPFYSNDYPLALRDLADAPSILSVDGTLDFDSVPVLAVVGARHSSVMSESWMRRFLPAIAHHCIIVSGGARGIDELAHAIAVGEARPTAVVLPTGLLRPYPNDWRMKRDSVLKAGGVFISEYPPETEIRPWHFEKRNRLIAALADVVLVVEARSRSGTAITARHAMNLGRGVAALPWFPTDPRGEYCNELLSRGSVPIRDVHDLASLLGREVSARKTRTIRQGTSSIPNFPEQEEPTN
ncbi:MAG: DNA-protecting protein DprA [Deltaproteobacteria bacterium]|jgi:DNA processing protein|nr:DNA-protecting protein DprA [Deltaproteobacteria bacterium]